MSLLKRCITWSALLVLVRPAGTAAECVDYRQHLQPPVRLATPSAPVDLAFAPADSTVLYLADGAAGLLVVDLDDLHSPRVQSTVPLGDARLLAAQGSLLAVGTADQGVRILDIGDPAAPSARDSLALPGGCRALALSVPYLFAAGADSLLRVIDLGGKCLTIGTLALPGPVVDLAVRGGLLAASCGLAGVQLVDVSDPAHPSALGLCWDWLGLDHRRPPVFLDVELLEGALIVAGEACTDLCDEHNCVLGYNVVVASFDLGDPAYPRFQTARGMWTHSYVLATVNLRLQGRMATLGISSGQNWIDVSSPLATLRPLYALLPGTKGPLLQTGGMTLSLAGESGLFLYENVEPGGGWTGGSLGEYTAAVDGRRDLVAIYDNHPGMDYGRFDVYGSMDGGPWCIHLDAGLGEGWITCAAVPYVAYLSYDRLDVMAPPRNYLTRMPSECDNVWAGHTVEVPYVIHEIFGDVAVSTEKIPGVGGRLILQDVADFSNLRVVGTLELPRLWDVTWARCSEARLYLAYDDDLWVVDVTNPAAPRLLTQISPVSSYGLAVEGSLLYHVRDTRLEILDMTDVAAHPVVASFELPVSCRQIGVMDAIAYLDGPLGLLVVDCSRIGALEICGLRPKSAGSVIATVGGIYISNWYHPVQCSLATPTLLQSFAFQPDGASLLVRWALSGDVSAADQRLSVRHGDIETELPVSVAGGSGFEARDPGAARGGPATYRLSLREPDGWRLLAERRYGGAPPPPRAATLLPPRPNPFNPRVEIAFDLARPEQVRLTVHDLAGRCVAHLAQRGFAPGRQAVVWEGRDDIGRALPAGGYVVRIVTAGGSSCRKLTLLR